MSPTLAWAWKEKHIVYHQLIEGHKIAQESPLAHPATQDHPIPQNHATPMALAEPGGRGLKDGVRARLVPICDGDAESEQPSGLVPPNCFTLACSKCHLPRGHGSALAGISDGHPTTRI